MRSSSVRAREDRRLILDPDQFYILASRERVQIPSDLAAEMAPVDPGHRGIRVHYAGFFDPGFESNGGLESSSAGRRSILASISRSVGEALPCRPISHRQIAPTMSATEGERPVVGEAAKDRRGVTLGRGRIMSAQAMRFSATAELEGVETGRLLKGRFVFPANRSRKRFNLTMEDKKPPEGGLFVQLDCDQTKAGAARALRRPA
jgi:hypothetical protein